jgi:hypothetical protein
MSALFNFEGMLTVLLLMICTCAYVKAYAPHWVEAHKTGIRGVFYKFAVIGERLSPFVAVSLVLMGVNVLWR